MKYTAPLYEIEAVETNDIVCSSAQVSTYIDKDGNAVEEHDYSFSSIFKSKSF